MFNILKHWMNGSQTVKGTPSVHPNPSSVAEVEYYKGHTITNSTPADAFSDSIMSIAPVGYSSPNPTNIKYNMPRQKEVIATPEIRTTNAPKGRDC